MGVVAAGEGEGLGEQGEGGGGGGDGVVAEGDGGEGEGAVGGGAGGEGEGGVGGVEGDFGVGDGAVLRVVDDAAELGEDGSVGGGGGGDEGAALSSDAKRCADEGAWGAFRVRRWGPLCTRARASRQGRGRAGLAYSGLWRERC